MNQLYQIKESQPGNKGVFAKKNLQKYQQIIQCEPIAWATLQSAKSKHCNWCFLQKQLVKCSQCKSFYYCSTQCQKNDWKYHKLECKIFAKMCTQKNLSIHKQIATLYYVLQQNKQLSDKFYSMCSLEDYQPLQKRQHFQQLSLVMMENLGIQKNQANMSKLMKQMNILSVNAFTIQDLFYTSNGVAVGIYWPANYLNHACNANCTQVFDGRYLKIIANQPVHEDDQLTLSYTNPLQLQKDRSTFLKQNYFFQCFCELCQVEKMINTQFAYIKCPECKQSAIRKKSKISLPEQDQQHIQITQKQQTNGKGQIYECIKCKKQVDIEFLKKMAQNIQQLPQKVQKMQSYKQKKQQLLSMKKDYDLKHPAFYRVLQTVYLSAINEGLLAENNQTQKKYFNEGNIILNQIIKNLTQWYKLEQEGLINIKFFSKYNEMSKLAYNMSKLTKCIQYLQKAKKCIEKLNLKNKYTQIQQLNRRYDQVKIQMSIAKSKTIK